MNLLTVMLGGAIGAGLRFGANSFAKASALPAFAATGTVNILGSFLIGGAFALLVIGRDTPSPWALFFITGLLGGFTTFSAFSLELMTLLQNGRAGLAFGYALLSVMLGLLACWLGFTLAQMVRA